MNKEIILFCDFDGTITERDNIVDVMKQFAPAGWESIVQDILQQRISIREGVGKMFDTISSDKKDEIIQFVLDKAQLRAGFEDFVQYTRDNNIRLLITSGGIDFFVYPKLEPFSLQGQIFCNSAEFDQPTIQITWPNACDEHCDVDCGMCKTSIIRSYPSKDFYKIVIGDSITDLAGAKIADFTIARSFLKEKCEELSLPHAPFETFYDVIDSIKQIQLSHTT